MKAVILAGGLGTRLQPYTIFLPKAMLPLGEKPLLEHLIEWVKKGGIDSFVLCVSYLRKTIEDYFEDGSRFGVKIEYAVADRPLATAGQLKTAEEFIDDTFVCLYGDSIFDFNLKNMIDVHRRKKSFATMGLFEYKTKLQYGFIETDKSGTVKAWREKPEVTGNINIGCYVMEPGIFKFIPQNKPYGMDDVIRNAIAKKNKVGGYLIKSGFIDIGDKMSYRRAYQQYITRLGRI
ncbi:Nucleotidyl transferase [Nitrosotalea sinensis]|uniref:Nucleotidyl transferase n=1 Tax=Nitrosotalea sinensis TaxID=1499975 RepID=A0A2H1EIW9_9ARCH|nr:nucleotidyltransferase family protein [Candidatus Nitrosotalea sinensis]SHO47937.1 Nucleotidyl transferase [Candidatus Nitrosotalea sinensis]